MPLAFAILPPAQILMKRNSSAAFTLIELLVVIAIIAVLASIAVPVFSTVQVKGAQTKALSNGKQIGLALRLYAGDNNGNYPSFTLDAQGAPTTTAVASSNDAFCQLFPNYVKSEAIFWLAKSKWCGTNPPDEVQDATVTVPSTNTLKTGENEWAYVLGLNDSSNPSVPVIADGFVTGGQTSHTYTKDQTQPGGVWKAVSAIVIRADNSGTIEKVNQTTLTVTGPNGTTAGTPGDIFTTTNSANGWLGATNTVVNPK
jgi:prepilin-type N-terminal cleavage/methylation domain-containing protein